MSDEELREMVKHLDAQRASSQIRKKEQRKQARIIKGEEKNLLEDF